MSENPLTKIPNIEEPTPQVLTPQDEISLIKSGYYSARATLDFQFEQTVGQLYQQLLQKNEIVSALQKEIANLKKQLDEIRKFQTKPI